jgi:catechol 2,3-dioxygenase-like lactoylglutathione lyase family enzyme
LTAVANAAVAGGLARLCAFTLTTPDPAATAQAYCQWLDYVVADEGSIDADLAQLWGHPALAGRSSVLLHAPRSPDTLLRLVEVPALPATRVAQPGHGWNAMEVLVRDPYSLADQLRGSPFKLLIPPRPLPFDAAIHAMQVVGPAGELLYLTALPADRTIMGLHAAQSRVDRPFIAILGCADIAAVLAFYAQALGTPTIGAAPTIVKVINHSFGLPDEHRIPLGIVKMARDSLIEVDQLPAAARPRPCGVGELPAGFAVVSFECTDLAAMSVPWLQAPRVLSGLPYRGRRAGLARGAAGELIELIESSLEATLEPA